MSQLPSKERNAELRERARGLQHKSDYGWRELVECLDAIEELSIAVDFADAATELVRKERDELLKDKAILDAMDAHKLRVVKFTDGWNAWLVASPLKVAIKLTFRDAANAAMTGGGK